VGGAVQGRGAGRIRRGGHPASGLVGLGGGGEGGQGGNWLGQCALHKTKGKKMKTHNYQQMSLCVCQLMITGGCLGWGLGMLLCICGKL
jgi:hypothetical protein